MSQACVIVAVGLTASPRHLTTSGIQRPPGSSWPASHRWQIRAETPATSPADRTGRRRGRSDAPATLAHLTTPAAQGSATAKLGPRGSRGRAERFLALMGTPPQVLGQMKAGPYWARMQSFARTLLASRWRHCDAAPGVSGSPAASLPFHARPRGDLRRDVFCPLS